MHFSRLLSITLRCVLKCETFGCHFSCQSLLLVTNVPNDIVASTHYKKQDTSHHPTAEHQHSKYNCSY